MYVALNIFNLLLLNRPNKLVVYGEKNPLYCPQKLCESDEGKLKNSNLLCGTTRLIHPVHPLLLWKYGETYQNLKSILKQNCMCIMFHGEKITEFFSSVAIYFFLFKEKSSLIHAEQSGYIKQIIIHQPQNYYVSLIKIFLEIFIHICQ